MRIPSVWVGPLQSMPVHRRQCEGSPAVTRDSRYGYRGVRIGEASNPGPPRTRARARMEQEAEVALTGLEAATARIDDSSDDEPLMPTWRDEVSPCAEVGRGPDVRNVWARVGDSQAAVVPTLLDSLGSDQEPSNPIPGDVGGHSDDECSSARSESCWGEMEDIGDDEVVDWGVTQPMSSVQVVPSPHALSWSQRRSRRPVAGRDVAPGLDSTTQVNSAEGPGQVSGELLDALERDLNVVVAPKRRVRRVFNDDDESVVSLSRGRFQALSSDEEPARGELPTQVDRESSVFDMTVADSPDEDEDRVVPPVDVPRGRRVVLIRQSGTPRSVHNMSDEGSNSEAKMNGSDTDSLDVLEENGSVVSGVEEPPPIEDVIEMDELQGTPAGFREALQAIDEVNLDVVFRRRANVIKSVPHILKRPSMKVLLEEIVAGHERERGWKAFMLLPRLLLHRKCRGGKIGKEKLRERFDGFRAGR